MAIVVTMDEPTRWTAWVGDDPVGGLAVWLRPDGRRQLMFHDVEPEAYRALVDAAGETPSDLVLMDEEDTAARLILGGLGFHQKRSERVYEVPVDPELTGLEDAVLPGRIDTISAAYADVDQLRYLDDTLRQDVPGCAGWRSDPDTFVTDTFGPQFDEATYLVALDHGEGEGDGEYVGLIRIWWPTRGPRLGLVGVRGPYRRRGIARALLARAFAVVYERGYDYVRAEVDVTNEPSNALVSSLGARVVGSDVELVRE
jgi:RimJ/RimL family protein N-acetyltransferase